MEKNKSWSLLADYEDLTGAKNTVTLDLARKSGVMYNSQSEKVTLYINGEYMGMYTLIEKVEIDDGRIEIADLESMTEDANESIDIEECEMMGPRGSSVPFNKKYVDIPNNPDDITGGYLLEFDFRTRYHNEISGFTTGYGTPIVVKSPEYASKEQVEYIAEYYQKFEDAVRSENGCNEEGVHYSEYLDVESAAKVYLINEFSKNRDAGLSSTYIYKDVNEKMYMGPVWDYDLSFGIIDEKFGERNGIKLADPEGVLVSRLKVNNGTEYTIFALLCAHEEFRELVKKQWQNEISPLVESFVEEYDNITAETTESAAINATKWMETDTEGSDTPQKAYRNEVLRTRQFIIDRAEFLDKVLDEEAGYICYMPNGKDEQLVDYEWYAAGNIATILEYPSEDENFICWNTAVDGSGEKFMPGDEIEITEPIVLYAQWEEPPLYIKIIAFFKNLF